MTMFGQNRQFTILDRYLKQGLHADAVIFMKQWQNAYLAMFQYKFPEHRSVLTNNCFHEFWQQKREALSLKECPGFHFMAQQRVSDSDFVMGYLFYLLALKAHKKRDDAEFKVYIEQAISYSSFYAVQLLLQRLMEQETPMDADLLKQLAERLLSLQEFANQHGCPGYLLLAYGYFHLASHAKDTGDLTLGEVAFGYVWKYLHLARLAEADSSAEINNAYFGLGFSLSTPFKLNSIEKMLEACKDRAGISLPLPNQNYIKNKAVREYQALKKSHLDSHVEALQFK